MTCSCSTAPPIDARNLAGSTALYAAAENGRSDAVDLLLRKGADPNLPGRSAVTPLAAAAYKGNEAVVALLLAHRADPTLMDSTGKGAIIYAAARGFPAIVRRLLDAGVAPDARYGNDLTALMWAAGHEEGVDARAAEAVIAGVARPWRADRRHRQSRSHRVDDCGRARRCGRVGVLLERGADRVWRDKQGKTAFDLAASAPIRARLSARP